MAHQCGFCGATLSDSEFIPVADGGAVSLLACPQCGNWSGRPATAAGPADMTGRPPVDAIANGRPFNEPYRLAVAVAGALMLLFSAYCPMLYRNIWALHAERTLFSLQPLSGYLVVGLAFLSIGMAVWGFYRFMWISVTLALFTIVMTIFAYVDVSSRILEFPSWGWGVAFTGLLLMLLTTKDRLPGRA